MFDYYQIVDFKRKKNAAELKNSFLKKYLYEKISSYEYSKDFDNSFACYLEREKTDKNHFEKDGLNIFIYGTVYTNNLYKEVSGENPKIIYASYVHDLFKKYEDKFTGYIKGSFVIVVYNEKVNEIKIITDRLNVMPLYYAFKDEILVISSSVRMILESGFISKEINNVALVHQLIFDYVLGTETYFNDISRFNNGTLYLFNDKGKTEKEYWNVEKLYNEKLISKGEALEMLSSQLHENTNLYCSDTDKLLVALTGGFDGRANLALLDKKPEDFLCYSYGMQGSRQIEIPKLITKELKINYNPVLLDAKYEAEHDECTLEAIEYSNGNAPIIRSNYPYAYKILSSYSRTIMTGLFGSEVMRPLHNLGIMMNDYSEKLFLSDDPKNTLREIIKDVKSKNYIDEKIIDDNTEAIVEKIYEEYFEKYKNYNKILRFFFFIIQEGVRKYFSQEIQIERMFVTTRFPFFDDDFVQLMFKTPFAGMYNGFLGKSKIKRRKGQLLYAYIYRRFKPGLGKVELDRGYKPEDLLRPFPFNYLYILKGVRKISVYKKIKGNDTFDSVKWTKGFITNTLENQKDKSGKFACGLKESFYSGAYTGDLLKYSHMISVYKYINSI